MKTLVRLLRPCRLPALLAAGFLATGLAFAKNDPAPPSTGWPAAGIYQVVTSPAAERVLTQDEVWSGDAARHQILDTGGATRTITLAPIGAGGIPAGSRFAARVSTRKGDRILFRRNDGELLAFWGADDSPQTRWIVLAATADDWDAQVSTGCALAHDDPRLSVLGARLQDDGDYARPASPRTNGCAFRFETAASLIYVSCRARDPRFRVAVDGRLVADVAIDDDSGRRLRVPVALGSAGLKRVEILADALELAAVETPDARADLALRPDAAPAVRMLWIGDSSIESGTRAYPWLAARLLDCEVWSRSWGDDARRVAAVDRNAPPLAAIDADIAAVNPDIIVISGDLFDEQLEPKAYADVVRAWFEAMDQAARPEAVKLALPSSLRSDPHVDREVARRIAIISKEARRRDFHVINWHDWLEDEREEFPPGSASRIVSENGIRDTAYAQAFVAGRFVEQFRRFDLDRRIQLASVKRLQSENATPSVAAADPGR